MNALLRVVHVFVKLHHAHICISPPSTFRCLENNPRENYETQKNTFVYIKLNC